MVFAANSGRQARPAGGSSASTTGLFLSAAALAILSRNGLVIGLYQRVVRCKPYYLEVDVAVLVEPCRKYWLLNPLARVPQERLLGLLVQRHVVKVRYSFIVACAHCGAKDRLAPALLEQKQRQRRLVKDGLVGGDFGKARQVFQLYDRIA